MDGSTECPLGRRWWLNSPSFFLWKLSAFFKSQFYNLVFFIAHPPPKKTGVIFRPGLLWFMPSRLLRRAHGLPLVGV